MLLFFTLIKNTELECDDWGMSRQKCSIASNRLPHSLSHSPTSHFYQMVPNLKLNTLLSDIVEIVSVAVCIRLH